MQILLNSQVHESIVEYINGDECRSHQEVNFNYVELIFDVGGWIYSGSDLNYPKIQIKMAGII